MSTITDHSSQDWQTESLRFTPFHAAGVVFIALGLLFAVYRGLMEFGLAPTVGWMTWSHIHYVTIGGFTQLLFGMLPQLAAFKLERPFPSKRFFRGMFVGLNGAFIALWYGRAFGSTLAFDAGLAVIWLATLLLFLVLMAMVMKSTGQRAWDATIGLYLLSPFVLLFGVIYAIGLFSHPWQVPGGWHGLREAHVHANAWGFLGLAVIGTLYEVFPRLVKSDLYSDRLKAVSFWLFAAGIFPLITGPWLGMGQTVTTPGLTLFGAGFLLYFYNLTRTYQRGVQSRVARSILTAQVWILGPAVFAPFLLFGLPLGINSAWVEQGALHFFFLGWALPIALSGLLVYFRNLPCMKAGALGIKEHADVTDLLPIAEIPTGPSKWTVLVWNLAVLAVGFGFFFQDQQFATYLHGIGWPVLIVLWAYQLGRIITGRKQLRSDSAQLQT
jgi:cytochrome c oxidase cbb3-type subunit 1